MKLGWTAFILLVLLTGCADAPEYDVIIRNGVIYDGSGGEAYPADIGISADRIMAIGDLSDVQAEVEIDAEGNAVTPGFINMLSWATVSLITDGNSQSDIRQGVTLEVMGEGESMGPLNDKMKSDMLRFQSDFKYNVDWTTLGEYLESLVRRGISTNVASFVGATTLRIHEIDNDDRPPTDAEMQRMKDLTRQAMEEGALGIGSSLIYAPAFYAATDELIELCKVAAEYDGMYISHLRSEGDNWLEAIDELIKIASEAGIRAEIYHLKAGGKENWSKFDAAIAKIDSARASGLEITTDMYNYIAGATGLDAAMPPWVQEGGYDEWAERLKDPDIRRQVILEMKSKGDNWENLYNAAGNAENVRVVSFRNPELRKYTGMTLAAVAADRNQTPEETAIELVIEDGSRVGTVYFLMSEENVVKQIKLPYMSFGSDAGSLAPVEPFTNSNPHPRAYGNFARLLGKYVRDEKVISLEEAIYRLTTLPATNLKIEDRGAIQIGYFADIAIFDPNTIEDHATFDDPHQYSTGMQHVLVNGVPVLLNGSHTGARPGRVVRGPGWKAH